jgi:hypothetical protein
MLLVNDLASVSIRRRNIGGIVSLELVTERVVRVSFLRNVITRPVVDRTSLIDVFVWIFFDAVGRHRVFRFHRLTRDLHT